MATYAYPLSRHQARLTNVGHSIQCHLKNESFVWIDSGGNPASTTLSAQFSGIAVTTLDVVEDGIKSYPTLAFSVRPAASIESDHGELTQAQEFNVDLEGWCNVVSYSTQIENASRTEQQRRNIVDCLKLLFELHGSKIRLRDASNVDPVTKIGAQTGWLNVQDYYGYAMRDQPGRLTATFRLFAVTTRASTVA